MRNFLIIFSIYMAAFFAQAQIIPIPAMTSAQTSWQRISTMGQNLYSQNKSSINAMYNMIWKNSDQANASPCQMWTAGGTSAVKTRTLFLSMATVINGAEANSIQTEPSGYTLTQNSDGSISCSSP